ncbi:sensor histidine kinase [Micropruina sp.]|uniref:sensor histidine kinase n=1 Tax=Micropruina sp. TaxID=2737536 RepID=UPI0039E40677
MRTNGWRAPGWLAGRFDATLAIALVSLAVFAAISRDDWRAVPLDAAACLAAALIPLLPRIAGVALAVALLILLLMPAGWPSVAEYAPLIPILGTGMRGERQLRTIMTGGYGALLAIRSFQTAPSLALWPFIVVVWAALIGVLWGVGNLFTAYQRALSEAHAAHLQEHRFILARELHDTVARDLARASLHGQSALAATPSTQLEATLHEIQQASTHLRLLLALLREPDAGAGEAAAATSTGQSLDQALESLRRHGLLVRTFVEGDLDTLPPALLPTVQAVVGEACANMERHADPAAPCAIMINVSDDHLDAAFFNHVRADHSPSAKGFGLDGVAEHLALVGGNLVTEQKGGQWICRVSVPL